MTVLDKKIYKAKHNVIKIIAYNKEAVPSNWIYVKQIKNTPYRICLFGHEFKMPWSAKETEFCGVGMEKYNFDVGYYNFFAVHLLDTDERKLYYRPRVEIWKCNPDTVDTTYFIDYNSALMYADILKEKYDLICNEENNSN